MNYLDIFANISNFVESVVVQGGYFIIFITTIVEGVPVLGMIIPGHVAIVAGGFLSKMGTLSLGWVLTIAITGALLGDFIGFYLGRKYGLGFIHKIKPYLSISDLQIDRANVLLSKHTGKTLILGRFIPATRALMPFLVGTTNIKLSNFWFFNIVGGISWVTTSVFAGYIFGAAYNVLTDYIGKIILLAVILSLISFWGYRFINHHFNVFRKYELFTLILNILSLLVFSITIDRLIDNSFKLEFDIWVNIVMNLVTDKYRYLISFAEFVSSLGSVYMMIIFATIISSYCIYNKKWRSGAIMLLTTTLVGLSSGLLKYIFMSPRPINSFLVLSDPSFPSSHSSMSAAIIFVFIYLFAPKVSVIIKREVMIVFCILFIFIIGLSRLILNVHWFSDIIGGWSLGIFFATGSILFIKYISQLIIRK